mmetsp:Transcript_548/g.881  ORF Transcript_548/g.881 Transcript_548/m.881 type:complete len:222 (-) Transcript_548:149-814(-)
MIRSCVSWVGSSTRRRRVPAPAPAVGPRDPSPGRSRPRPPSDSEWVRTVTCAECAAVLPCPVRRDTRGNVCICGAFISPSVQRDRPYAHSHAPRDPAEVAQEQLEMDRQLAAQLAADGYEVPEHLLRQASDHRPGVSAAVAWVPPERVDGDDEDDDDEEDEDRCCSVCMEPFRRGQNMRTLPCFHKFHKTCVEQWLQRSDACPVCQTDAQKHSSAATWQWS